MRNHRVCVIKYSCFLAALCSCAIAAGSVESQSGAESQSAADAQAKLQALRGRIEQVTDRIGLELKERDALSTRLRGGSPDRTARSTLIASPPPRTRLASTPVKKNGYDGPSIVCSHCGQDAKFINHLPRSILTVNGEVELSRAYYRCPHCKA